MSNIVVYHGATQEVTRPICAFGRAQLDFGRGFYVTDLRQQAVEWAVRTAHNRRETPVLNRYMLNRKGYIAEGKTIVFKAYDEEWFDFIVASRMGMNPSAGYDYIEGGVANDRVVDSINFYLQGQIAKETALRNLSGHQPNNKICLLNQQLTDKYLIFDGTEQL